LEALKIKINFNYLHSSAFHSSKFAGRLAAELYSLDHTIGCQTNSVDPSQTFFVKKVTPKIEQQSDHLEDMTERRF